MKTLKLLSVLAFASLTSAFAQTNDVALAESSSKEMDRYPVRERRISKLDPSGFKYEVKNLKVNSPYSDLTNHIFRDKFVYSSSKKIGVFKSKIDPKTNEAYKELFCGDIAKNREIKHSTFFSQKLNSEDSNETYVSFTGDEKTVYYTKTVKEGNDEHLKIYKAVLDLDRRNWSDIEMLDFNVEGFDYDTPYITKDGKTLFFASNMPGTLGGYDLFMVKIAEDGTMSKPVNMGNEINTTKNEKYPYMITESEFYYSSEGHYGLGGYDIFESKFVNNKFHFPTNMGSSINSISDDFGFLINEENAGYFTSNREGGKGGYDIYAFERNKVKQFLDIQINDEEGNPITNANIVIKDEFNQIIKNAATNNKGELKIEVLPYNSYAVYIKKEGYNQSIFGFEALNGDEENYVYNENIKMIKEIKYIELEQIALDAELLFKTDKWDVNADVLDVVVSVLDGVDASEIVINAFADNRNSETYNLKLSEKRGDAVKAYLLAHSTIKENIIKVNYFGETNPKIDCDQCTADQLKQNRRVQIIIKKRTVQVASN